MGSWALGQSLTDNWDASDTGWQNGPSAAFSNVQQGATLVLCVYGYTFPNVPFGTPTSSAGQPVVLAVDTGSVGSVQGACWVVHGAAGGSHALSNLPDFTGGDGKLFFAEFRREVGTSTLIYGANTSVVQTFTPPWLDTGTVTMSEAAEPGDLVIAFGLEEEGSQGSPNTQFSDPPAGWQSLGAQQATIQNIGGQASWKNADSSAAQSATWTWSITGGQDPSLFLGGIFAVR